MEPQISPNNTNCSAMRNQNVSNKSNLWLKREIYQLVFKDNFADFT